MVYVYVCVCTHARMHCIHIFEFLFIAFTLSSWINIKYKNKYKNYIHIFYT